MTVPIEVRFWAKVNFDGLVPAHQPDLGPCWLWTGATDRAGYGQIAIGRRADGKRGAHRVAFALINGFWPPDHTDHLCRTRVCIRPAHLEAVTQRENLLRGIGFAATNAVKTACLRGHPLDDENTFVARNGSRSCRACRRAAMTRFYEKAALSA